MRTFDVLHGFVEDREVSQAQKVHLQQADLFDSRSVPLRDDVFLAGDCLQRQHGIQRHVGNHHSGRVCSGTACQTFDRDGEVQQFAGDGVVRPGGFQVGTFLQCILQANVERVGHHSRQLVDSRQRHIQSSPDIANGVFGLQSTVGPDLRNVPLTVLLLGVVDDHLPPVTAEVDIDIGRLVSAGIEKAFEEQVVLQRADVTQSQQISHDCSARGTSGAARNAIAAGKLDKVPDDQEVTGVTLRFDHTQFIIQPLPVSLRQFLAITLVHAFTAQITEVLNVRATLGRSIHRVQLALTQLHVDSIGNLLRSGDGVFQSDESRVHFFGRADVQSVMLHLHAFFVVDGSASIDAEHHVLNFGISLSQIVGVVGGNQRQPHLCGQIHRHFHTLTLNLEAGILDFQIEAVAEDPHVPFHQTFCVVLTVRQQQPGQL